MQQFLSILCILLENLAKLYVGTPTSGGLAPPPTGNPGSAPNFDLKITSFLEMFSKYNLATPPVHLG